MKFVYQGPYEGVDIPALGISVLKGDEFEATGEVAAGLEGQPDFVRPDKASTDKKEK